MKAFQSLWNKCQRNPGSDTSEFWVLSQTNIVLYRLKEGISFLFIQINSAKDVCAAQVRDKFFGEAAKQRNMATLI